MKDYSTPLYDSYLKELGFNKFFDNPVYYREEENIYRICFDGVFKCQKQEEEWIAQGKFNKDNVNQVFIARGVSTLVKKPLEYWTLLILTADFYYHNGDTENHKKYVDLYESLTNKKYR